ncbi:MAG: hypothetical protein JJT96_18055 [Opitutales bacterium]|nr:hypothetical protein [Opitutales bacterium]
MIKVPNHNCLNRKVRQGRWCGFRYPDQVNYFTPETLGGMIRRSGLTLYRMRWYDRWPTNDNMYAAARAERLA